MDKLKQMKHDKIIDEKVKELMEQKQMSIYSQTNEITALLHEDGIAGVNFEFLYQEWIKRLGIDTEKYCDYPVAITITFSPMGEQFSKSIVMKKELEQNK